MTCLAMVLATSAAPSALAERPDPAERLIERINETRAKHGLRALRESPRLMRSSRGHAVRLARTGTFSHGSSYRRAGFARAGETLALRRGWSLAPGGPLGAWLHSRAHRALVLDGGFRYVGAGRARGRLGGAATTFWVAHFGAH